MKSILIALLFISNQGFAQLRPETVQQLNEIEQFNFEQSRAQTDEDQNAIDSQESGGDTDQEIHFDEIINSDIQQPAAEIENNDIFDIAGILGQKKLQDFVSLKVKNKGHWASQFIFIDQKGQRTVLSSLNANASIKPASTLKLFTGYLAFVEKSYSLTNLSLCLHKSDNEMADAALKSVAIKKGADINSDAMVAGLKIMKSFYKNLEDSSKFHPVNGSGLNTTDSDFGDQLNKATVRMETHLLEKIIKDQNFDVFKKLLAQPGQFGTLNKHLRQVQKIGRVYAKTGTLAKTKALAGYVQTKNGILVFSIIGDQLKVPPKTAFAMIEQIVAKHVQVALALK